MIQRPSLMRVAAIALAVLVLGVAIAGVWAQVAGDRGIAPVVSSSDIEVSGIEVDVTGDTAEEAREKGWRQAQRMAWEKIDGPAISQSQLESLVSAVVIERERVGPKRYIARLGVVFDRARAGGFLGSVARGRGSAPMLLMPVTFTGGTAMVFEQRNPWQRAWAEFNPGTSQINYVRPSGAGGDSLLLTYGQSGRRSRTWWRGILDQFGAADVIIPIARLEHSWPGGPVTGQFTARYGPDSRYLDSFTLTANNAGATEEMLGEAVRMFDAIFEQALADGKLRPDPTLDLSNASEIDPALQRLIDVGRAIRAREEAIESGALDPNATAAPSSEQPVPGTAATVTSYVVQFASPDAATIDATLQGVRSAAGVRGAVTSSLAIGGTSVMRVTYGGSIEELAQALRSSGFTVQQGSNALAISR